MAKKNLNWISVLGVIATLVFLALYYGRPSSLESLEASLYGAGVEFGAAEKTPSVRIALLEIDERSLTRLGPWPWPRQFLAEMIDLLDKGGARLIGMNLPLFEEKIDPGLLKIRDFRKDLNARDAGKGEEGLAKWVLENLNRMEEDLDSDAGLVRIVGRSGKVLLPVFGRFGGYQRNPWRGVDVVLKKNFLTGGNVPSSPENELTTPVLCPPFKALSEAALGLGHGHLFFEDGEQVRSHPLFVVYRNSPFPSFPLRTAVAYLNLKPGQVALEDSRIRLKDYVIPLADGKMLLRPGAVQGTLPRYSFGDLLAAKKIPPAIRGSIVLIGMNTMERAGIGDAASPPVSEGEWTARIIGNILNREFISRPALTAYLEPVILLILGCFAAFFFPGMGQIGRLIWAAGLTALTLLTGVLLLSSAGIWFRTVYCAGCIIVVYGTVSLIRLFTAEKISKDSIETNRLLGLSFQSQGLLDLAFDKFRKLPLDQETRDLIYNLGLEYERKRMMNKAVAAYEYANEGGGFRDLDDRIPRLKESDQSSTMGSHAAVSEGRVLDDIGHEARKKVGRYEILGELGKGSMGLVYKALDPKINRALAIKTIRFSDEFDEDVIHEIKERFFREAEIAGQLSHPSIVTIYDVGDDGELTYMAMEFLEGDDLEKFINKKSLLPFRKVLDVVASIADALEFAHRAEVIHRDIKPANIMLLKTGGVKVTDFGIAKAISSSRTKTGVILGTPNYMSPEQIMGQKIDHRSDIFSLGVLFFQLVTGETPFHGDNLSSLLYQITQVKQPPVREFNPKIPKVCDQIIDKALAKNPKERFKSAGEMAKYVRLLASKIDQLKKTKPS